MKKITLLFLLFPVLAFAQSNTYLDERAMFMKLVRQVQDNSFKFVDYEKVFETAHQDRNERMVSVKTLPASNKVLSRGQLYNQNKANVYRFVKAFVSESSGKKIIDNVATAFPISEDGHFIVNYHMVELWDAGSGVPAKPDPSSIYFLADYDGNILSIDSICSYNEEADMAIIKANTKGKKIKAFSLGSDPQVGDDVFIIAHPKAYLYYFSMGMVNRLTQKGTAINTRKMEISADFAGGSSGGPIFDDKGNIVGLVSLTQSFYYEQSAQTNLQMVVKQAVPVSVIKAYIK